MMNDVVLTIYSAQKSDPNGEDSVEFTSDGLYSFDGECCCLTYMESEVTGLEGTRTSIMVLPDKVVVDRDGMVTSRMVFQEGLRNSFQYNTPYGTATLSIDTRAIRRDLDADGGRLIIDYDVNVEHTIVSRNFFKLTVTRQKPIGG